MLQAILWCTSAETCGDQWFNGDFQQAVVHFEGPPSVLQRWGELHQVWNEERKRLFNFGLGFLQDHHVLKRFLSDDGTNQWSSLDWQIIKGLTSRDKVCFLKDWCNSFSLTVMPWSPDQWPNRPSNSCDVKFSDVELQGLGSTRAIKYSHGKEIDNARRIVSGLMQCNHRPFSGLTDY